MLFPMLPGAKSYDQPIASYMAFKLGVTLFFDHPVVCYIVRVHVADKQRSIRTLCWVTMTDKVVEGYGKHEAHVNVAMETSWKNKE